MKLFDLPGRGTLAANEEQMPRTVERHAANDLRSYLQPRSGVGSPGKRQEQNGSASVKNGNGRAGFGPPLNSLDAVLDHLSVRSEEKASHIILVMAAAADIDASRFAVDIARALLASERLRVLVDLTRGAGAVSDYFGFPRAPGFAELAAGTAGFDDVVQVDDATTLQLIPAGRTTASLSSGGRNKRLVRIFEALAQAYDVVVLHADRGTALTLRPILAGRLQRIVAVLARGQSQNGASSLLELAIFGCPVVPYQEEGETQPRRSLTERIARWA